MWWNKWSDKWQEAGGHSRRSQERQTLYSSCWIRVHQLRPPVLVSGHLSHWCHFACFSDPPGNARSWTEATSRWHWIMNQLFLIVKLTNFQQKAVRFPIVGVCNLGNLACLQGGNFPFFLSGKQCESANLHNARRILCMNYLHASAVNLAWKRSCWRWCALVSELYR